MTPDEIRSFDGMQQAIQGEERLREGKGW